jgi:hypothetical protein
VVLIFAVARLIVAQIGGDDPFVSGFREITDSVLGVPVRNGLIVLSAGVIVVASSIILARADRLLSQPSSVAAEEDF